MNRSRRRLLFRDLSAGAAFGSIALSGSVPLWAIAVFLVGWSFALINRRLLAKRVAGAALALTVGGIGLFGMAIRGAMDLVVAACTFTALVTLHRVLSIPDTTTDKQVHLSGVLMMAGAAALSGEWFFGLSLAVFVVLTTLSVGLGLLEEFSPDEEVPSGPPIRMLTLGALVVMVGAVVFFVLFPRLSWNVASRRVSPGLGPATTGFSDRVRLGGGGNIKTNPRTVLRASLSPDPGVKRLDAYWVGRTFDRFNGRDWTGTARAQPPAPMVTLGVHGTDVVRQTIELLPAYDSATLVALESPVGFSGAVTRTVGGSGTTALIKVPGEEVRLPERALAVRYQAFSRTGVPTAPHLDGVSTEAYLQLPEALDPRIRALAAQAVGAETDPLKAAEKLKSYLQRNYAYSLELGEEVSDPLAHFLFNRRAGHCEHFATALTLMLRTQGIPARVAAGFFGGERIDETYVVRAGDAHAWTQVLVPDRGFVTIDATPEERRAGQPSALLEPLARAIDYLEGLWRRQVLDYSLEDQLGVVRGLVRPPSHREDMAPSWMPSRRSGLALLLVLVVAFLSWRLWRTRHRVTPHPASRLLVRLERIVQRAGVPVVPGEAPQVLCTRLTATGHPLAVAFSEAIRPYLGARFGGMPLSPAEEDQIVASLEHRLQQLREMATAQGAPP